MNIRIYVSGDVTHRKGISLEKGALTVEGYGEDEVDAILGLVAKAIARRNPTAGINPLDRIAAVFEKMEEHRQEDDHAKREFEQFKAKMLVRDYLFELVALHEQLAASFGLLPIEDLRQSMEYAYKQVTLGDALDALHDALDAKKQEVLAMARTSCGEFLAPVVVDDSKPYIPRRFVVGDKVRLKNRTGDDEFGGTGDVVEVPSAHAVVIDFGAMTTAQDVDNVERVPEGECGCGAWKGALEKACDACLRIPGSY